MAVESKVVTIGGAHSAMPLDTDTTLAADSDARTPTQKAVKAAIAAGVSAATTAATVRAGQQYVINAAGLAKVGGTAGWVVAPADNLSLVTCPASQTASKMVIPITMPLKVGSTITAFSVIAQIESAGGTVTIDADLRKLTTVAADITDASLGAITQVSVTADTAVAAAKSGLAEIVAANETFYVLVTATTAGSTDIALQGITLTLSEV